MGILGLMRRIEKSGDISMVGCIIYIDWEE